MWLTLAWATALSLAPAQAGDLRLLNERATYGLLGAVRADDNVLPGDQYFIAFDAENLKVREDGKVHFSMAMDVTDSKGKSQYKQQPEEIVVYNSLGGSRVPMLAHIDVGLDMPAGQYTIKVTVTDLESKKNKDVTRKFQVLPKDFGIVRVQNTLAGQVPAPPIGVVGQTFVVNFVTVGFERDKTKKQPNLAVEMVVYDENKKPTLTKAFSGEVNQDVPENVLNVPMQFFLTLNTSGSFTVELKATDLVSKKTSKLSFPIKVLEIAK